MCSLEKGFSLNLLRNFFAQKKKIYFFPLKSCVKLNFDFLRLRLFGIAFFLTNWFAQQITKAPTIVLKDILKIKSSQKVYNYSLR